MQASSHMHRGGLIIVFLQAIFHINLINWEGIGIFAKFAVDLPRFILKAMKTGNIIRLTFIAALWGVLCYLVLRSDGLPFMKCFAIVASGIIVFAPLYKKYKGKKE